MGQQISLHRLEVFLPWQERRALLYSTRDVPLLPPPLLQMKRRESFEKCEHLLSINFDSREAGQGGTRHPKYLAKQNILVLCRVSMKRAGKSIDAFGLADSQIFHCWLPPWSQPLVLQCEVLCRDTQLIRWISYDLCYLPVAW